MNISKALVCVLLCTFASFAIYGQDSTYSYEELSQTVKGKVIDKEAKFPLLSVFVFMYEDTVLVDGVYTDLDGYYAFEKVPIGRYHLEVRYIGYQDMVMPIIVTSGKEVIVDLEMVEAVTELDIVKISVYDKSGTINEMAAVSARMFDAEETGRYAGSRLDAARMASNYAGVQGADDSRNDIIVRGNSPAGVLWRVNGIAIPSPNHFAVPGTAGSAVTMLNNKTLANSDFYTGAFPAEFGNTVAGAFDLNLRSGNREKHEFSGQFGFLGTELVAEGPIKKGSRSSYLGAFRYSTLSIFNGLGINIGTSAVPEYLDLTFKLNFPGKKRTSFQVFGIGGNSDVEIKPSENNDPDNLDLYGDNDRDQYFGTATAVVGASVAHSFNEKLYLKSTFAVSREGVDVNHYNINRHIEDGLFVLDSLNLMLDYEFNNYRVSNATTLNYKHNKKNLVKSGINYDYHIYEFSDSVLLHNDGDWNTRWDFEGNASLIQFFTQWKHKFSNNLEMNLGWHGQFYTLNNSHSLLEPRAGIRWKLNKKQALSAGIGVHSQTQIRYAYFFQERNEDGSYERKNTDMDFTKSNHYVLGYDHQLTNTIRMKLETYYQHLYNIPVEVEPSAVSIINQGAGYTRYLPGELENTGIGRNIGIEMTLEKFFSSNYFFMFTGSLYDSKYRGSDGIWRNTDFNGNYTLNGLGGFEKRLGQKTKLGVGTKITWAGGKRYGVIDSLASIQTREVVYLDERYNEFQFSDYFRVDLKINFFINAKKVSHEIAFDLVNVFNRFNILNQSYNPIPGGDPDDFIRTTPQLGRLPIFYYKIDF